ncbi:glycolate oxidase subunit GlcE [Salinisphaera sp. Q1T1-3]|uniref:glycolate oxidase subunit GlcE n=1 Tax=Salinisphaera sp. Q1T1-3 TaxID=2321229 RepID=UPI000E769AEA|nr:glycolate oxidase subunit GlcE [Salinisphaera sp. Q1T1-3]RJS92675.1 glycolate oxidase subunit GlcE [Salinisphaera sp. Q1T1-3]
MSTTRQPSEDRTEAIAAQVEDAYQRAAPLRIVAGQSKSFLGEPVAEAATETLAVHAHSGVVSYDPGELIITARAGTPLRDIEAVLAENHQRLAFEPPHYGPTATLGGTIATGVSGPARPYAGAARDFVLGCRIVNGRGQVLRFGGEVMKNVAGYDLSRLMAGAHGTLGVLLEISLKVLPSPRAQLTQVFEHEAPEALAAFSAWAARPWPISGAYWEAGRTHLRLSGAQASVDAARDALGGEPLDEDQSFWSGLREHERDFFKRGDMPLWRISCAPASPMAKLSGTWSLDWGGAQRWLVSDAPAETVREAAATHGGHATLYRGHDKPRQHPLSAAHVAVHRRLKAAMDPAGILNPGRIGV